MTTMAYSPPQQQQRPALPSDAGLRTLRAVLAVLGLVGLVWAFALMLVPLQHLSAGDTCGPGYSSHSALGVWLSPQQVRINPQGQVDNSPEADQVVGACKSLASERLIGSLALGGGALALGFVGPLVAGLGWYGGLRPS